MDYKKPNAQKTDAKKRKLKITWKMIVLALCVVVACSTAYMLAQPGITINNKAEEALKANVCPDCSGKLEKELEWVKSSRGNPFGGASKYGVFLFGDLTDWNDTESNVALLGNLVKRNTGITYPKDANNTATHIPMPDYDVGLMIGGTLTEGLETKGVNILNGSVICTQQTASQTAGYLVASDGHIHKSDKVKIDKFFADAKKDQQSRNQDIFNIPSTGTVTKDKYEKNVVNLKGTDPKVNIFKITAEHYSVVQGMYQYLNIDVPFSSSVIINVDGAGTLKNFAPTIRFKFDKDPWGGYSYLEPANKDTTPNGQKQSQRVLFNMNPEISKIELNYGFYLYGSLLAPNVEWDVRPTNPKGNAVYVGVNGTAVLKSANGNGTSSEFHYNPFIPFEYPGEDGTSISVEKKWQSENGSPMIAPSGTAIKVQLYRTTNKSTLSPNKAVGEIVELNAGNGWKYTWTQLEKSDAQGKTYYYYVREVGAVVNGAQQENLNGFDIIYQNGAVESGNITITNKKVKNTEVSVNKVWLDSNGKPQEPAEGTTAEITLYASSQYMSKQKVTKDKNGQPITNPVKIDKASGWSYSWKNLAEKDAYGYPIEYSVEETPVDGYIPKYKKTGNNFTVENNEIAKYKVRGKKVWKNSDGTPMSDTSKVPSVKVQLYKLTADKFYTDPNYIIEHGKPYGEEVWLSEKNGWVHNWEGMTAQELIDGQVKKCSYAVKEVSTVPGFGSKLEEVQKDDTGSLLDSEIVNTQKDIPTSKISVTKQWQNASGDTIDAPEGAEVEIQLYRQLIGEGEEGKGHTVKFKFPGIDETFNVKPGTTFKYTVKFMHKQNVTPQDIFSTKPPKNTYEYKALEGNIIWISSAGANFKSAQITGSVKVTGNTEIVFGEKILGNVFSEGKIESWEKAYYPVLTPEFEKPKGEDKVLFTEKYGAPINLSANRNWHYEWTKLPNEAEKNGVTYKCRYFVVETKQYEGFDASYIINGKSYDKLGPGVNVVPEGISQGDLLIVNKSTDIPGLLLPETGSSGTLILMILGVFLVSSPILYYVFRTRNERRSKKKS